MIQLRKKVVVKILKTQQQVSFYVIYKDIDCDWFVNRGVKT